MAGRLPTAVSTEEPCFNYIWVGNGEPKIPGHDIIGPLEMAKVLTNPINYWCLDSAVERYKKIFSGTRIQIHSIEAHIRELTESENSELKDIATKAKDIRRMLLDMHERKGTESRDKQSFKNVTSLLLLITKGGYIADSNVYNQEEKSISLPELKSPYFPVVIEKSGRKRAECWLMGAPTFSGAINPLLKKLFDDNYCKLNNIVQKYNPQMWIKKYERSWAFNKDIMVRKWLEKYHEECAHAIMVPINEEVRSEHVATWSTKGLGSVAFILPEMGLRKDYYNSHTFSTQEATYQDILFVQRFHCILHNDLRGLKRHVEHLPLDINHQLQKRSLLSIYDIMDNCHHQTLAYFAVKQKSLPCFQILLENGADIDTPIKESYYADAVSVRDRIIRDNLFEQALIEGNYALIVLFLKKKLLPTEIGSERKQEVYNGIIQHKLFEKALIEGNDELILLFLRLGSTPPESKSESKCSAIVQNIINIWKQLDVSPLVDEESRGIIINALQIMVPEEKAQPKFITEFKEFKKIIDPLHKAIEIPPTITPLFKENFQEAYDKFCKNQNQKDIIESLILDLKMICIRNGIRVPIIDIAIKIASKRAAGITFVHPPSAISFSPTERKFTP